LEVSAVGNLGNGDAGTQKFVAPSSLFIRVAGAESNVMY
jgi:hypothetical protein